MRVLRKSNTVIGTLILLLIIGFVLAREEPQSSLDTVELERQLADYVLVDMSYRSPPPVEHNYLRIHRRSGELRTTNGVDWGGWNDPGNIGLEADGKDASRIRRQILESLQASETAARRLLLHQNTTVRLVTMEALQRECDGPAVRQLPSYLFVILEEFLEDSDSGMASYAYGCIRRTDHWSAEMLSTSLQHENAVIRAFAAVHMSKLIQRGRVPTEELIPLIDLLAQGLTDPHPAVRQQYHWAARQALKAALSEAGDDKRREQALTEFLSVYENGTSVDERLGVVGYVEAGEDSTQLWDSIIQRLRDRKE